MKCADKSVSNCNGALEMSKLTFSPSSNYKSVATSFKLKFIIQTKEKLEKTQKKKTKTDDN